MRILFHGSVITDNSTGIGRYAGSLLNQYEQMEKPVSVISHAKIETSLRNYTYRKMPWYTHIPFQLGYTIERIPYTERDIIHYPVHRSENVSSYVINRKSKKILTIHDLIPFHTEDPRLARDQPDIETQSVWKWALQRYAKKMDAIIAGSACTKRDIIRYLGVPEEKVHVIYVAANPAFRVKSPKEVAGDVTSLGINRPYIFYTGGYSPRKNTDMLVRVFRDIQENHNHKYTLVMAGGGFPERYQKYGDILSTGHVTTEQLVSLYNGAEFFIYPSLFEGFGVPPLEAMACGCPVITSNTSSLPEVVGDAALTVNPDSVDALTFAMQSMAEDKGLRASLQKRGLDRSRQFRWEKTARETWTIYDDVSST